MKSFVRSQQVRRWIQNKLDQTVALPDGLNLADHREENFVRMVCDGIPLGEAYCKVGFTAPKKKGALAMAATQLVSLPRIKQRMADVLKARMSTAAVSLPEVTDMLKRVYTGALYKGDYGGAHNAAFSIARLYGLIVDRAQLEVIRRPSRDPDAPAERALSGWIEGLPSLERRLDLIDVTPNGAGPASPGSDISHAIDAAGPSLESLESLEQSSQSAAHPEPSLSRVISTVTGQAINASEINKLATSAGPAPAGLEPQGPGLDLEKLNIINWLAENGMTVGVAGGTENGAPTGPVTGTPHGRTRAAPDHKRARAAPDFPVGREPKELTAGPPASMKRPRGRPPNPFREPPPPPKPKKGPPEKSKRVPVKSGKLVGGKRKLTPRVPLRTPGQPLPDPFA